MGFLPNISFCLFFDLLSEYEQTIFFSQKPDSIHQAIFFAHSCICFIQCLSEQKFSYLVFMNPVSRKYEFCSHAKTTSPVKTWKWGSDYIVMIIFSNVSELLP